MPLTSLKITDFRCLASVDVELDGVANVIVGANGSGKTSVLEAIGYLGRGKSFRGAATTDLVRHGQREFVVFGQTTEEGRAQAIGVRNGRDGLEISVNGRPDGGAAALAQSLPLQIIDPDVHNLVSGGPDERRRFLDWVSFHVEPGFVETWRRFRRVLKQRNAALKASISDTELDSWDREFEKVAGPVSEARARVFGRARPVMSAMAERLLQAEVGFEYRQGWPEGGDLGEALVRTRERDQALGSTQVGPHRADLRLRYDDRLARKLVSRGQQKLLACSMVLGATEIVQTALKRPLLLLLDDPAAELDSASLARLMQAVSKLHCQVIATALVTEGTLLESEPALFHVEHGELSRRS